MVDIFEVFEYPLLSEVVLELRFPTRLSLPEYIGIFQDKIIEEFPKLNEGYLTKIALSPDKGPPLQTDKVWDFKNPETKTLCKVLKNRFSIISNKYKSWDQHKSTKGFRNILEFTLEKFLDTFPIKTFERIGLRYINKVEMEEYTSNWLNKLFIPIFDIEKYPIESLNENFTRLRVEKQDDIQIILQSTFINDNNVDYYILDFDAYLTNIEDKFLMEKADQLHVEILKEFHSLITDECRKKMRGELKNE
ncbi:MAG: TIGR04255 family protein [Promethearchaeota archaeon]|nr:MAG: TIGR04255 family protein [Candidatus Lokiarchaeota archaeon]